MTPPVHGARMRMRIGNHNFKSSRPLMSNMKLIFSFLSFLYCANALQIKSNGGVYNQWIATIDDNADCDQVTEKVTQLVNHRGRHLEETPSVGELKGPEDCFVVFDADDVTAEEVAHSIDEVEEVSPNEHIHEFSTIWNLDRVDQTTLPLDKKYNPAYTGKGVNVYIVDTGVEINHNEFEKRASRSPKHYTDDENNNDNHGHGTHCAGTAAGKLYGVANGANVIGVKVLGANGGGSTGGVIQGIQWAVQNAGTQTAVISMSLGGPANSAMKKAVLDAAKKHIVVVAAGNSNTDACSFSPANAGGKARKDYSVITVGSTTVIDRRSSFSNYGKCVDIWAPGSTIKSAWKEGGVNTISGTSMATPHVAGAAALYLEKHKGAKNAAMDELFAMAVGNEIVDVKNTVNLFVNIPTERKPPGNPTVAPTFPPTVDMTPFLFLNDKETKFWQSKFGPVPTQLIDAPLVYAKGDLCDKTNQNLKEKIVIVTRGNCYFRTKVANAQKAGALAVLIHQDSSAIPFTPGCSYNCAGINIPSAMITKADGKGVSGTARWGPRTSVPSMSPTRRRARCKRRKNEAKCLRDPRCQWLGGRKCRNK